MVRSCVFLRRVACAGGINPGAGAVLAVLFAGAGGVPLAAHAQGIPAVSALPQPVAPSQVTPGGNRQRPVEVPRAGAAQVDTMPAPLAVPDGAGRMPVLLTAVEVAGGFPELAAAEAEFRRAVVGRRLTLGDVYAAAGQLEAAYAHAGFVLVRIALPPQRIDERGSLRVDVIDGSIEAIDDAGLAARARAYVRAHLAPLVGRKHVRLEELERRLTLAGNAAGLALHSALRSGTQAGTARLVVAGTTRAAIASVGWDNSLPASLGGGMLTANVSFNNLAGLGEQISLTTGQSGNPARWGKASSPFAMVGGNLGLPLGHNGLSLTASYLRSRTLQAAGQSYLNALGHFEKVGAGLTAAPVARHDRSLLVSLGLDTIAQSQALPFFAVTLNRDDYTTFRLGVQGWRRFADGGYVSGEIRLSQGLLGRAAPTGSAIPYSQAGARADYTRLDGMIGWRANLDAHAGYTLSVHGQSSFGAPLFVAEKLALAANDGISGTLPGGLAVDSGVVARQELSRNFAMQGKTAAFGLAPYAFSSAAWGLVEQQAHPTSSFLAMALGAGVRLTGQIGALHPTFGLEYGRCLCAAAQGNDSDRINFSAALGF